MSLNFFSNTSTKQPQRIIFNTSGTFNPANYPGATKFLVECWGGGGGGGASDQYTYSSSYTYEYVAGYTHESGLYGDYPNTACASNEGSVQAASDRAAGWINVGYSVVVYCSGQGKSGSGGSGFPTYSAQVSGCAPTYATATQTSTNQIVAYGAGGGGGAYTRDIFKISTLTSPVSIVIGSGGEGGYYNSSNSAWVAATAGGNSSFGNLLSALGGAPGAGAVEPATLNTTANPISTNQNLVRVDDSLGGAGGGGGGYGDGSLYNGGSAGSTTSAQSNPLGGAGGYSQAVGSSCGGSAVYGGGGGGYANATLNTSKTQVGGNGGNSVYGAGGGGGAYIYIACATVPQGAGGTSAFGGSGGSGGSNKSTTTNSGSNGSIPGGGGGGAWYGTTAIVGGNGAAGRVVVTVFYD